MKGLTLRKLVRERIEWVEERLQEDFWWYDTQGCIQRRITDKLAELMWYYSILEDLEIFATRLRMMDFEDWRDSCNRIQKEFV